MNKSVISGRLTKEIELRYSPAGMAVLRNTIAVNRYSKQDGQPTADFIPIVAFGKTAELIEKYSGKGKRLMVSGKIQTGSYDNAEGKKVYTMELVVDEVEFTEFKDRTEKESAERAVSTNTENYPFLSDEDFESPC